jgi:hypothetical protein
LRTCVVTPFVSLTKFTKNNSCEKFGTCTNNPTRWEDVCECDVPETCGCSHCQEIPANGAAAHVVYGTATVCVCLCGDNKTSLKAR